MRQSVRRVWCMRTVAAGLVVALGVGLAPPAGATAVEAPRPGQVTWDDAGVPGTQTGAPLGLDRLDQRDFGRSGTFSWLTTGRNVHAYVLGDTVATTHATFGGRASMGTDFTGGTQCPDGPWDNFGTGLASAVGGTRHGVAKEVRIVGVRIASCSARTTSERLVQGLDWVTANAVKPAVAVLNITHPADSRVDAAALHLVRSGVTLVTTSGQVDSATQDRDSRNVSPARVREVITVAQTWANIVQFAITRLGPNVDLFAPFSHMAIGTGVGEYDTTMNEPGLVAGAAALVLAVHPDWTPAQVSQALTDHATPNLINQDLQDTPNLMLYTGP
ncbi:S8 family serine peptidase [Micromonospora sp. WMMD1102]|uniref:S8 family serine peptidase n=1 Tax=Micromonospora sp. WMMD1102 TaxID=3016105 RepID=UPI002415410B|nr:S8 family serine peptidase [Micromonospora sp. WMMD1102]MDG4791751.1 S8 family serine peptidase [Micromonospora sp. WMMD1102]